MFDLIKKAPIHVKLSIAFFVALFSFLTALDPIGFGIALLVLVCAILFAAALASITSWIAEITEEVD